MSIKHSFESELPDSLDNGIIKPTNWNESHDIKDKYGHDIEVDDLINYLNVKHFGAVGDNSTDDTVSINNAISEATNLTASYKNVLYFPQSVGYKVTEAITIPNDISVVMDAPLYYDGSMTNSPALTIGDIDNENQFLKFELAMRRTTHSIWDDDETGIDEHGNYQYGECVGIRLNNAYGCDIRLNEVWDFTIGLQCAGYGNGFVYNNLNLGTIWRNKIGLELLDDKGTSEEGWVNQNTFIGGRFGVSSTDVGNCHGIRLRHYHDYTNPSSPIEGVKRPDNNLFLNPAFEFSGTTRHSSYTSIPISIENGSYNTFLNCRSENTDPVFAVIGGNVGYVSHDNILNAALVYNSWLGDPYSHTITESAYTANNVYYDQYEYITAMKTIL